MLELVMWILLFCLCRAQFMPFKPVPFWQYLAHLCLYLRQVIFIYRLRKFKVKIESVFYCLPYCPFSIRPQFHDGSSEQMCQAVSQAVKPLLAVQSDYLKISVFIDWGIQVR